MTKSTNYKMVLPGVLDQIIALRRVPMTANEIAEKLNIKEKSVYDAIKYAELIGRLTGKETREARYE